MKYFLYHNQDEEIKTILQQAVEISEGHIQQITVIFNMDLRSWSSAAGCSNRHRHRIAGSYRS
ncbi:hypothetical protein J2S10_002095 [Neobacillus ginsengisoli]|uniref:Uncharacterized protein n=1 Tax=Neobacillus ginsengisoli TaxID=904295 RepID=A0ABT9XTP9_9BACI|nr:hypothetical protein [Neobacillus ginsengisoli]